MDTLEKKKSERMARADAIGGFMFELMERDQPLDFFDERLWLETISCVYVGRDGLLTFKFQNGMGGSSLSENYTELQYKMSDSPLKTVRRFFLFKTVR